MKTKKILNLFSLFILSTSFFVISCVDDDSIKNNTVKDIDGNVYKTITIGGQTWMAENLKTTRFTDSTSIPLIQSEISWSEISDTENTDAHYDLNSKIYYTNSSARKACPIGWHLPSESDWQTLINHLENNQQNANGLKAKGEWYGIHGTQDICTDDYGFSAYQTGILDNNFGSNMGTLNSYFWSSTICSDSTSKYVGIFYGSETIEIDTINNSTGIAIRCIKN